MSKIPSTFIPDKPQPAPAPQPAMPPPPPPAPVQKAVLTVVQKVIPANRISRYDLACDTPLAELFEERKA
jgi:hypothetical protein